MTNPVANALDLLLNVYFHQDWDVDSPTADAVVESFAENELPVVVRGARDEAAALLASGASEREIDDELTSRHFGYDPTFEGRSDRQWLELVVARLSRLLEQSDDSR
jgi:hypothetical protein